MSASPLSVARPAEPLLERASDPSMEEILASIRRIIADEQESHALDAKLQETPAREAQARDAPGHANHRTVAPVEPGAAPMLAQVGESEFESWLQRTANGVEELAPAAASAAVEPDAPHIASPAPDPVFHTGFHAGSLAGSVAQPSPPSAAPAIKSKAAEPDMALSELTAWIDAAAGSDVQPQHVASEAIFAEATPVYAPEPLRPVPAHPGAFARVVDAPAPPPVPNHAPEPVQQTAPLAATQPPSEPAYAPQTPEPVQPNSVETPLLSGPAGASVQSSFQALARTMFMQNSALVNDAVQEMLRPMLKQWLDDNLPVIVERLVRAEIERVARGGGR